MASSSNLTEKQRTPTRAMAEKASRGLELREKYDRGGTEVGVKRANQLKDRRPVDDDDIKSMYSYFARHAVDKKADGWADRSDPSAGYIAWLLWGGDPGRDWVGRLHDKLDDSDKASD